MSVLVYLVVDGHGDCRLTKRRPALDWDEVAFPITVQVPSGWGRIYDQMGVELTLPPEPSMRPPEVGAAEMDPPEEVVV